MIEIAAREQAKILNWVDLCPQEISGLGTVIVTPGKLYVDKVFLLNQEVSATETELDPTSVVQLMNTLSREDNDRLFFWWHSHVNMDTFWSGTDDKCISNLLGTRMVVSVVYNKKGKKLGRVDVATPLYARHDNVPVIYDVAPYRDDVICEKIESFLSIQNPTQDDVYNLVTNGFGDDNAIMKRLMAETLEECTAEYKAKVKTKTYTYAGGYRGNTYGYAGGKYPDYTKHIGYDPDDLDSQGFTTKEEFGQAWLWGFND